MIALCDYCCKRVSSVHNLVVRMLRLFHCMGFRSAPSSCAVGLGRESHQLIYRGSLCFQGRPVVGHAYASGIEDCLVAFTLQRFHDLGGSATALSEEHDGSLLVCRQRGPLACARCAARDQRTLALCEADQQSERGGRPLACFRWARAPVAAVDSVP